MKMPGFKMPHMGAIRPTAKIGSMPKIHPAAQQTRVRLPDTGSIGADAAPFVPHTGKI